MINKKLTIYPKYKKIFNLLIDIESDDDFMKLNQTKRQSHREFRNLIDGIICHTTYPSEDR